MHSVYQLNYLVEIKVMCVLVLILLVLFVIWWCYRSEYFGRGGPVLDFLPTVGEFPTGEGGYVDEEAIPFQYRDSNYIASIIEMRKVRKLSGPEKLTLGTSFRYVTISEFSYRDIIVPDGFLTNYNSLLVFYDYLYATHTINGKYCTKTQADRIIEDILKEEFTLYHWLFIRLMKLNPFWFFDRRWKERGLQGPQMISYGLKKLL